MKCFPLFVWLLAATTPAVVIRDDLADAWYKEIADKDAYKCVGRIATDTTSASGVYIGFGNGAHWLLTAAHVSITSPATVNFAGGISSAYSLIVSSRIAYDPYTLGLNDLALIKIHNFGSSNLAPAKFSKTLLDIPDAVADHPLITSVGFGQTGTGITGQQAGTQGTKRGFRNRIDAIGTTYTTGTAGQPDYNVRAYEGYMADFDNDTDGNNTLNHADNTHIPAGAKSSKSWEQTEGQLAPGDSGGGLFRTVDDQEVLVGINSYNVDGGVLGPAGTYGTWSGWTAINRERALWIRQHTGIEAVPEPCTLIGFTAGAWLLGRRKRRN
ncbi:MAG: PEP-CTERM sorting domain-containing protein [Chthonomonas sp.]|nr:PEP-CTERM sorting domain-containing protein [Chthonomonas sp.]